MRFSFQSTRHSATTSNLNYNLSIPILTLLTLLFFPLLCHSTPLPISSNRQSNSSQLTQSPKPTPRSHTHTEITQSNHENVTVTFSGFFNITTTIRIKPTNKLNTTLNMLNLTTHKPLPWTVSSSFNLSASRGGLTATFSGGGTSAGNGGHTSNPYSGSSTVNRKNSSANGMSISGDLSMNQKAVAGINAASANAENGGAAGSGGNPCIGIEGEIIGDCETTTKGLKKLVRKTKAEYARVDGKGSVVGVVASNGSKANGIVKGYGVKTGNAIGAALSGGNSAAAGTGIGSMYGNGVSNAWSDEDGGLEGIAMGVGTAKGIGTGGGGGGAAATGGGKAIGHGFVVHGNDANDDEKDVRK